MKKLKILCAFLSVLLAVLTGILVFLIVNRDGESMDIFKHYERSSYREYALSEEYVKLTGRSASVNGELVLSASGSGIEFICKGSYAEITVAPESYYISSSHLPRIAVYADGNLAIDECISEERTYRINTKYSGTKITLIKLSEAMHSSVKIIKAASYGMKDIEPTEDKDLRIEFIGDSITCGYGIDGGAYGSFTTSTENFTKTYAYLTAEKLDVLANALTGSALNTERLGAAWERVMFNQFHDILPGTCIPSAHKLSLEQTSNLLKIAGELIEELSNVSGTFKIPSNVMLVKGKKVN